jgi:hypothetical protein
MQDKRTSGTQKPEDPMTEILAQAIGLFSAASW